MSLQDCLAFGKIFDLIEYFLRIKRFASARKMLRCKLSKKEFLRTLFWRRVVSVLLLPNQSFKQITFFPFLSLASVCSD